MKSNRTYYTLAIKIAGEWTPEFGDYDREVVEDEMAYYGNEYKQREMKIVATSDEQQDIESPIDSLNTNPANQNN